MRVESPTAMAARVEVLASAILSVLGEDLPFTNRERKQIARLADELHCTADTAGHVLVYSLLYVSAYQREIAVAQIPKILTQFPIKWGYKKKRHDFLALLQEMGFVFVQTDYWAKVRAKKYALARHGRELLSRVLAHVFRVSPRK
jgi:hypothetical protein